MLDADEAHEVAQADDVVQDVVEVSATVGRVDVGRARQGRTFWPSWASRRWP